MKTVFQKSIGGNKMQEALVVRLRLLGTAMTACIFMFDAMSKIDCFLLISYKKEIRKTTMTAQCIDFHLTNFSAMKNCQGDAGSLCINISINCHQDQEPIAPLRAHSY